MKIGVMTRAFGFKRKLLEPDIGRHLALGFLLLALCIGSARLLWLVLAESAFATKKFWSSGTTVSFHMLSHAHSGDGSSGLTR